MKNISVLPADTYTVLNKTVINNKDHKIITMLYQPILGYTAVSLFLTLLDDLDKQEFMSEELTHHHLVSTMQIKLTDIIVAREKLEAVGLLKTFFKEGNVNNYVYALYSPLSVNDFFNSYLPVISLYSILA